MIRKVIFSLLSFLSFHISGQTASTDSHVGIVNFASCMTESKLGKQEQASFEALKKQMTSLIEDTEKQMNELTTEFNDPEIMDGLSPEAEEEKRNKFRLLNEELSRYQNQYYQVLNQANMKIIQKVGSTIQEASQKVAKNKNLTMVVNKEACFFYKPTLDVTNLVVAEMDRVFEKSSKDKTLQQQAPPSMQGRVK